MADCNDPTLRERTSLLLIPIGCAFMQFLRVQRRPGSKLAAALALALVVVAPLKTIEWPQGWWESSWGQAFFITISVATSTITFFVALGYKRLLGRDARTETLKEAAESIASKVEAQLGLRRTEFGVNIWLVRGMKGFKRLVREASVSESHHETPITWTKGKGIIGEAWSRNKTRIADLDAVRRAFPSDVEWCDLKREDRFRLSWDEFSETDRYHAVLAVPLRRHRFARHRVRGVVAIDSLIAGKAKKLAAFRQTPEFSAIRRTCEGAFVRDE